MEETPAGRTMAIPERMRTRTPAVSTVTIDSHISRTSIFLPRYSGVRPIIRPAMKTATTTKANIV